MRTITRRMRGHLARAASVVIAALACGGQALRAGPQDRRDRRPPGRLLRSVGRVSRALRHPEFSEQPQRAEEAVRLPAGRQGCRSCCRTSATAAMQPRSSARPAIASSSTWHRPCCRSKPSARASASTRCRTTSWCTPSSATRRVTRTRRRAAGWAARSRPSAEHPETILYNYLTNPRASTPRWYQEGSAVFMETWYGGGLGRAQGGYDEMVFRAMVRDKATFYDPLGLVSKGTEVGFPVRRKRVPLRHALHELPRAAVHARRN